MKKIRFTNATLSVFLRITALALVIWLLCMAALTIAVARLFSELFRTDMSRQQAEVTISESIDGHILNDPKLLAQSMNRALNHIEGKNRYLAQEAGAVTEFILPVSSEYECAAGIFSLDNDLLMAGGTDHMTFGYFTAEDYDAWSRVIPEKFAYTNISDVDLDKEFSADYQRYYRDYGGIVRFTGHFEGMEFITERMEYGPKHINFDDIRWDMLYESEQGISPDAEIIYAEYRDLRETDFDNLLKSAGREPSGLDERLFAMAQNVNWKTLGTAYFGLRDLDTSSLTEVVMFDYRNVCLSEETDPNEATVYYAAFAMRAEPLKTAMNQLTKVYITSLAAAVLLALATAFTIKRHFLDPIHTAYIGVTDGWGYVSSKLDRPIRWKDAEALTRALRDREQ